jgi:hypothetical protein
VIGTLALAAVLAGSWLPAEQLGSVTPTEPPQLAADARGDAVLMWESWNGAGNDILVSYRAAGSPGWPAPVRLDTTSDSAQPKIALDALGDATALWVAGPRVKAAFRPAATRGWQAPVTLSRGTTPISLGMDNAGDALAVWAGSPASSSYRPVGANWQAPVSLPVSEFSRAAMSGDGTMALAGYAFLSGNDAVVQAAVGDHGHWGGVVQTTALHGLTLPVAGAGMRGEAVVVWDSNVHGNELVQALSHSVAGWSDADMLSFPDGNAFSATAALDAAGDTLVAWTATVDVESSYRPAGGVWQQPVAVSPPAANTYPALGMNAAGDAVTAWGVQDNGLFPLGVAVFAPGSGWQPGIQLADRYDPQPRPSVAIDGTGDALVAWPQATDSGFALRVSIYDAGGPLLHAPYDLRRPSVSGTARPGGRLICDTGAWTGVAPLAYAYRWIRGARVVGNARRYRIAHADAGKLVACRVTATNALGVATASSTPVRVRR